ncbi:MAG: MMPL family transporter, partial [Spirochaetaceae bacterium]|nr:MMPL family transporter [Spirochaetaceae bacterium]
ITVLAVIPVTRLKVEPDVESLLLRDTETQIYSTDFDRLALLVKGDGLFTQTGLNQFSDLILRLGEELEAEEIIDPFGMITMERVGSRLRPVTMSTGGITPETPEDLADFIRRLDDDPFSRGLITSQDGRGLVAYFLVPKGRPYLEQDDAIREVTVSYGEQLEVTLTGTITFSAEIERYLTRDFLLLMALLVVTILLSYYLSFRSRRAMILPVVLVMTGTAWSLGFMGLMGWHLSMVSIVSPPLVLALGSSYSIHILSEYYRRPMTGKNKHERIIEAVTGVSGTIVMASLTTIIGLLCLLLASMPQTRQFAVSTSVGVGATALLSVSLFPAFLSLQRPVAEAKVKKMNSDILSRGLERLGPILIRRRWQALLVLISLFIVSAFLAPRVAFNTRPTSYFPEVSPVIGELKDFSQEVGGMDEITITLTAPENEANYFLRSDVLEKVHRMENRFVNHSDVSHLMSLPAYLSFASETVLGQKGDFTNRGLNLLVSRMFLSAGDSPAASLANEDFSRISLKLRIYNGSEERPVDEQDTSRIAAELEKILQDDLPEGVEWKMEGLSLDFLELSSLMRRDFLLSTLVALAAIGVLCTLAFRSLKIGILALLPLTAGIAATFILMVIFHIPLDMTTIMMSCIAIGVGVDDAIHFLLHHRREEMENPENPG